MTVQEKTNPGGQNLDGQYKTWNFLTVIQTGTFPGIPNSSLNAAISGRQRTPHKQDYAHVCPSKYENGGRLEKVTVAEVVSSDSFTMQA